MQTFDQILNKAHSLPEGVQKEVLHFIEFTLTKYNIDNKIQESTQPAAIQRIYYNSLLISHEN